MRDKDRHEGGADAQERQQDEEFDQGHNAFGDNPSRGEDERDQRQEDRARRR